MADSSVKGGPKAYHAMTHPPVRVTYEGRTQIAAFSTTLATVFFIASGLIGFGLQGAGVVRPGALVRFAPEIWRMATFARPTIPVSAQLIVHEPKADS
jgi:hypothetical protein